MTPSAHTSATTKPCILGEFSHLPDPKLATAPVFSGVLAEDLRPLLERARTQSYDDGQRIFERTGKANHAYIVRSGLVRISTVRTSAIGEIEKRVTVEIFQEGDLFGELGVVDEQPRTADASAMGATRVAALDGHSFRSLMQQSPAFSVNLLRMVTTRLRRTYMLLEDASLLDLEHRLARQVLYLIGLGASGERRVRLYSRLNQGDLANLLGTTQRSIIKILNKWRVDGLADFDGRTAQLTILEVDRFKALLSDSPLLKD